jgi:coenzyme F420-0:L-glutamate ligase
LQLYPIKSAIIHPGDSITAKLVEAISSAKLSLKNGDVVAIASKIVSLSEGNIISLTGIKPSAAAKRLARKYELAREFAQIVLDQSEAVYGGVSGAVLSLKDGNATANSGVDRKNAPRNTAIPWPASPHRSAMNVRKAIKRRLGKRVGVVIVDSRVTPLRLGTIGLAIGCSGFQPVKDTRGTADLFGRRTLMTFRAIADGIAGAAHLLMGETRESIPFVLVRGAPITLDDHYRPSPMTLPVKDCLYMSQIPRQQA